MGEVYRARDGRLERDVAIKVLPDAFARDAGRLARFAQEARAIAALNHPNICTVFDIGEAPHPQGGAAEQRAVHFLVMELLDGRPLQQAIGGHPLAAGELLPLAIQIADALDASHARGVIHRDLKPANIIVSARGHVKILDFGLAKVAADAERSMAATQAPLSDAGMTVGTVAYMSPEQARGEPLDARTDLFSFGALLYEAATGRQPFQASSDAVTYDAILNRQPPAPSTLAPEIGPGLERVISKALEKDRQQRYTSAAEMKSALDAVRRSLESSGTRHAAGAAIPSIAVLPFADLSAQRDQDYFCEGMADELINALAALPGLQVTSRTSAFQFKGRAIDVKEIGAKLQVETVLEGSVRKAGNRLRITAQLVKVRDGFHLWSERYDRDLDDVFAVQDEIARTIVEKLKVKLSGAIDAPLVRRGTDNIDAYQACLEGHFYWLHRTGPSMDKALAAFERAIALDPSYAKAYAGLADVYTALVQQGAMAPEAGLARAQTAAARALALDDELADAHYGQYMVHLVFDGDLAAGERHVRRAIELEPRFGLAHTSLAYIHALHGAAAAAEAEATMALALEPVSPIVSVLIAGCFATLRRYDRALALVNRGLELDRNLVFGLLGRSWILSWGLDRHDEAVAAAEEAVGLSREHWIPRAHLGAILARAGRHAEAQVILTELLERSTSSFVDPALLVGLYLGLGDLERGFEWALKGVTMRGGFRWVAISWYWADMLSAHPRYLELVPSGWVKPATT
jgi:TolB-like protein